MCGIFCCFCDQSSLCHSNFLENVFERFEDNLRNRGPDSLNLKTHSCEKHAFIFAASVLWLQGPKVVSQPLENDKSVFIYNGDIFGGSGINLQNVSVDGDTVHFWSGLDMNENITDFLSSLEGPYAFIYFNKISKKLYFGRDHYGRRSLLLGKGSDVFVLCSVAKRTTDFTFIEIPTTGVFCYDLVTHSFKLHSWQHKNLNFHTKLKELENFLGVNIDIINTSNESNCSRIYLSPSNNELNRISNLIKSNGVTVFEKLFSDDDWMKKLLLLKELLETAIQKRIATQPNICSMCISEKKTCTHALTGVLFSGGVDCAILALLADKYTEKHRPIDLINVAFDESQYYETPDRLTGLQTLEELKKIQPSRKWNFLEVNVTKAELNKKRMESIADLIYPLNTILDDSLGCALWFASRALIDGYKSSCRILLVGMGADELFGGYTRHRNALKRNGWRGLYDALEEDWQNLPHRNLSRDDRVVSDHSHQLRTPYLDENVVKFVRSLNVWEKTCPVDDLPQGIGEKLLLRSLAYDLGLKEAAVLKKRALQFGSRIANKKENAKDVSDRLLLNKYLLFYLYSYNFIKFHFPQYF